MRARSRCLQLRPESPLRLGTLLAGGALLRNGCAGAGRRQDHLPGGAGPPIFLADGSGMPLAYAAELGEELVHATATVQLGEDVVEHEDRDADRRDCHADEDDGCEGRHCECPPTHAAPSWTLRDGEPPSEPFAVAPAALNMSLPPMLPGSSRSQRRRICTRGAGRRRRPGRCRAWGRDPGRS